MGLPRFILVEVKRKQSASNGGERHVDNSDSCPRGPVTVPSQHRATPAPPPIRALTQQETTMRAPSLEQAFSKRARRTLSAKTSQIKKSNTGVRERFSWTDQDGRVAVVAQLKRFAHVFRKRGGGVQVLAATVLVTGISFTPEL
ncbi:hypothetical protein MRX96_010321 [Rhipicephalus microplus]